MYQILKDNKIFAFVESPIYIRLHENGAYVETTEDEAQGIAIQGIPYQLLGKESMNKDLEIVGISKIDSGFVIVTQQNNIDKIICTILEV